MVFPTTETRSLAKRGSSTNEEEVMIGVLSLAQWTKPSAIRGEGVKSISDPNPIQLKCGREDHMMNSVKSNFMVGGDEIRNRNTFGTFCHLIFQVYPRI